VSEDFSATSTFAIVVNGTVIDASAEQPLIAVLRDAG
jgi:hypothetical protein